MFFQFFLKKITLQKKHEMELKKEDKEKRGQGQHNMKVNDNLGIRHCIVRPI